MKDWLSIGQFAKRAGVSARALRLYEKMGLIKSVERGDNGYRYYRESQVSLARKIREMKSLGFSLKEIDSLLKANEALDTKVLSSFLKDRLRLINQEQSKLSEQKKRINSILSSLKTNKENLNKKERGYVMSLFKKATIVVTGVEGLDTTAKYIKDYLEQAGQEADVTDWSQETQIESPSRPQIIVLQEKQLSTTEVENINPDIVVVKNLGEYSKALVDKYLRFYRNVGPHMATVLNADDRASIEIAKSKIVQKGKIYYFSKNSGLKDQIEKIGGIISGGEEINIFGFNRTPGISPMNIKVSQILSHDQEVALLASLGAVMDIGLSPDKISLTI